MITLLSSLFFIVLTIGIYQIFVWVQAKFSAIWLNPMLFSIVAIVPVLLWQDINFEQYYDYTYTLSALLEPAVVALGFPLYQHLQTVKNHWKSYLAILSLGAIIVIIVSFIMTIAMVNLPELAVSLSYKSVTTPIGIALTDTNGGISSITAFAIIIAGLFGAILGPSWLQFIGVKSNSAIGLAIGAGSHALGTATITKYSFEQGAFSSLALIISAVMTAIIGPFLMTFLLSNITI